MKKYIKFLIISLIVTSISYAKSLNIDEAIDIYYKNSNTIKNLKLDSGIREETKKELINGLKQNLTITAETGYVVDEETGYLKTQISYKGFYITSTPSVSNGEVDYTTKLGYEKTLNEFIYNTDEAQVYSNNISNLNEELTAKQTLQSSLSNFGDEYLEILTKDNTIKSTKTLLEAKEKELEIAKIKELNNNLSVYDKKVIEVAIDELQTELKIAQIEKQELLQEFQNLLGIQDEIEVTNISDIENYQIYKDDSSVKILENKINLAKDELKGLEVANLPELTTGVNHYIEDSYSTVYLGVTWYPLNYKGDEEAKKLNIKKLENQLDDAKKSYDLTNKETENTITKLQLNTELSKKTLDLAKLELEEYRLKKDKGTISEYDYFDKQKDVLDDEISYLNYLNQLNLAKKLQIVYSKI